MRFKLWGAKQVRLEGTWHICKHEFAVKAAHLKGEWTQQECKKCHVAATTEFGDRLMILVNPSTNRPYQFEPWGCAKPNALGIGLE